MRPLLEKYESRRLPRSPLFARTARTARTTGGRLRSPSFFSPLIGGSSALGERGARRWHAHGTTRPSAKFATYAELYANARRPDAHAIALEPFAGSLAGLGESAAAQGVEARSWLGGWRRWLWRRTRGGGGGEG
jgi:hypothetical protein